jgi:hypothetical protein
VWAWVDVAIRLVPAIDGLLAAIGSGCLLLVVRERLSLRDGQISLLRERLALRDDELARLKEQLTAHIKILSVRDLSQVA